MTLMFTGCTKIWQPLLLHSHDSQHRPPLEPAKNVPCVASSPIPMPEQTAMSDDACHPHLRRDHVEISIN